MYVKKKKYAVMEGEPHLGSLTEIELMDYKSDLAELENELVEEGLTPDEIEDYEFELDGYTFRLGDYI